MPLNHHRRQYDQLSVSEVKRTFARWKQGFQLGDSSRIGRCDSAARRCCNQWKRNDAYAWCMFCTPSRDHRIISHARVLPTSSLSINQTHISFSIVTYYLSIQLQNTLLNGIWYHSAHYVCYQWHLLLSPSFGLVKRSMGFYQNQMIPGCPQRWIEIQFG